MLLHKNPGWGGNDLITITTSQSPTPFRFGVCAHFESSVELGPVRLKSTTQFLQFLILGLHGLYVFRVLDPLVRRTRSRRERNLQDRNASKQSLGVEEEVVPYLLCHLQQASVALLVPHFPHQRLLFQLTDRLGHLNAHDVNYHNYKDLSSQWTDLVHLLLESSEHFVALV